MGPQLDLVDRRVGPAILTIDFAPSCRGPSTGQALPKRRPSHIEVMGSFNPEPSAPPRPRGR